MVQDRPMVCLEVEWECWVDIFYCYHFPPSQASLAPKGQLKFLGGTAWLDSCIDFWNQINCHLHRLCLNPLVYRASMLDLCF